jgi:hypothetical protein
VIYMLLLLTIWIGCGIIACGWLFAYSRTQKYLGYADLYNLDRETALRQIPYGLFAFMEVGRITTWGRNGWQWPSPREE